jgi:hypothetical protein
MRVCLRLITVFFSAVVLAVTVSAAESADLREKLKDSLQEYNPGLALAAIELSISVYSESGITSCLTDYGFERIVTKNYETGYNYKRPTFAMAERITPDGEKIIAIVIRGTDSVSNWLTNVRVGISEHHEGFYDSANYMLNELLAFNPVHGNTTYFITGYSYGAAIANLLAAELIDRHNRVSAYTFAAPNVTRCTESENLPKYDSIFNICNILDLVTVLPTHVTGNRWWRYGKTVYFQEESQFRSSFKTHQRHLYLEVMSRLGEPDENGIIGDIVLEIESNKIEKWHKAERAFKRRLV